MRAVSYHCTAKIVRRAKHQSAIAKAAYNAREVLRDDNDGTVKDYRRGHSEVLFKGIFAPKNAPEWVHDREMLWNEAEAAETRKKAQLAREVEVAFPHQLDEQQREWMLKDFVREDFVRKGMIADVAIHAPGKEDSLNYHAHILLTMREIDGDGFSKNKNREWMQKGAYNEVRADWAARCGKMLERAGYEVEAGRWRSGHLTMPEQRIAAFERGDLEYAENLNEHATKHVGPVAKTIEDRGVPTERGEINRQIDAANEYDAYQRSMQWEDALWQAAIDKEMVDRRFVGDVEAAKKGITVELPLGKTASEIRIAYALSDGPEAFRAALEDRSILLGVASRDDALKSEISQWFAREDGGYEPLFREGDIVAVNRFGYAYRLDRRTTGNDHNDVESFLVGLDRSTLGTVSETQELAEHLRKSGYEPRDPYVIGERFLKGDELGRPGISIGGMLQGIQTLAAPVEQLLGKVLDESEKLLEEVATLFEGIGGVTPPSADTVRERKAAREQEAERREAQAIDVSRYLKDEAYRQDVQRQEEERRQREQARDGYQRYTGREQ